MKEQEVSVSVLVPDARWELRIESIYQVEQELWVIAVLSRDANRMGAMMITTLEDSVTLKLPDLPRKVFVLGKTWNWENGEEVTFIPSEEALPSNLKGAEKLYPH